LFEVMYLYFAVSLSLRLANAMSGGLNFLLISSICTAEEYLLPEGFTMN